MKRGNENTRKQSRIESNGSLSINGILLFTDKSRCYRTLYKLHT